MRAALAAVVLGVLGLAALFEYLRPHRLVLVTVAVAVVYLGFRAAKWAFWPARHLPRNRVRHQRIRLYLRLHPGPGHATLFELHRHWGRRACYRRASQVRSS